jgi:ADP-heptose:LPS heptosyltransferase
MNEIIFAGGNRKIKVKSADLSLRDFYNRRNKVLIIRDTGGLGDILMMRMIFEDFKKHMPEAKISFATPNNYHRAIFWHPFIDEVLDSKQVDANTFGVNYDLTSPCIRYEMKIRPKADRHRAEIWTAYCGIKLTSPEMHLNLPKVTRLYGEKKLKEMVKDRGKGYVCFCPTSAMISKDLDEKQIKAVLDGIRSLGYSPFILHYKSVPGADCPVIGAPHDEWLALVNATDYVITVDSAPFHAANGFNKPTVAIFSWADGKVYTKFHKKCILIQRHRDHTPDWTCGPCYDHPRCPKTNDPRKPCITDISAEEILKAFMNLVSTYPVTFDSDQIRQPFLGSSDNCRKYDKDLTDTQTKDCRILTLPLV